MDTLSRSEGFPARDIWSLGVMAQGLDQMGRVLGTSPPPSPPSPPPPSLGMGMTRIQGFRPNLDLKLTKYEQTCYFFEIKYVLKIQKVIFSKNKRPLREATTIGHLLRNYPNRINSFLQRSQKWVGTQNIELLLIFIDQNQFFAENQNGPYGPYEQLLKDGKGNY